MTDYVKTTWVEGAAPGISAANLNKMESGIDDAHSELATHEALSLAHGELFVRKSADETLSNSDVMQNDNHLLLALAANSTYIFEVVIFASADDSTPDIAFSFTVPNDAVTRWGAHSLAQGVTTPEGDMHSESFSGGSGGEIEAGLTATEALILIKGIIATVGTAGNLQLRWAQEVATASVIRVLTNSYMRAKKVA